MLQLVSVFLYLSNIYNQLNTIVGKCFKSEPYVNSLKLGSDSRYAWSDAIK